VAPFLRVEFKTTKTPKMESTKKYERGYQVKGPWLPQ
jgi:hypothetical protein